MQTAIQRYDYSKTSWCLEFKLPDHIMQYLWQRIEEGKKKNIDWKHQLAGNISKSILLEDPDEIICKNIFSNLYKAQAPFDDVIDGVYKKINIPRLDGDKLRGKDMILIPQLGGFWANFQKKYEFNPLHDHHGMFSFVIWMDIPYSWEEEKKNPAVKSTMEDAVGNFMTVVADGECVRNQIWKMSPEMNGTMLVFPSSVMHQVFPFYSTDAERVSISGNVYYVNQLDNDTLNKVELPMYGI